MSLVRIRSVSALAGYRLRLELSDGRTVERDVDALLTGPVFEEIPSNRAVFEQVRVEAGTVAWPNGADLCPDTVIWGGLTPIEYPRSSTASKVAE